MGTVPTQPTVFDTDKTQGCSCRYAIVQLFVRGAAPLLVPAEEGDESCQAGGKIRLWADVQHVREGNFLTVSSA